jgi:hypothetical protein
MSWKDQLKGDALPWLLENESPGVRYLALRDLVEHPENDKELGAARKAAHQHGPIAAIVWSIILLAQLGAVMQADKRIECACAYLLEHAFSAGGQFTLSGAPSGTIDCLQGNLCWALLELGCDDPRLDTAFEWLARSVTGEGIAPSTDRQAEVRYYAGKCGPTFACVANNKLPCAWGAAKVMLAFSQLAHKPQTPLIKQAIQHGVDFLFSTDPSRADYPTGYSEKPSQNWWKFGFPVFYVTDLLQIVEALVGLGYGRDVRLSNAISIIREKQDAQGRWSLEYDYTGKTWVDFGPKKQPNKWVTLRALRVLKAIDADKLIH